jgi:hypothetical protein
VAGAEVLASLEAPAATEVIPKVRQGLAVQDRMCPALVARRPAVASRVPPVLWSVPSGQGLHVAARTVVAAAVDTTAAPTRTPRAVVEAPVTPLEQFYPTAPVPEAATEVLTYLTLPTRALPPSPPRRIYQASNRPLLRRVCLRLRPRGHLP